MVQSKNQVKDVAGNILDAIFCIVREVGSNGNLGVTSSVYIHTIVVKGKASVSRHKNIFTMADGSIYEI